ncbi:MAG TPA: hypothetical protein VGQ37_06060 [Vicinamibacterales bacterium]|jgi:Tfp pilus assembly protein PilN|nr:hypothetical protein [Vicinamibacterales bacterium]
MLRTNLSTRPFYNVRAVRALLGLFALVVAAFTLFNAVQLITLRTRQNTLSADAVRAENEAARLRSQAAGFRARIDPRELASVSADAKEANAIIDRRAFSWTTLFSQFEQALPPDVRITAVQPRREQDGTFAVNIGVQARRVEDVEAFIQALEAGAPFKEVLAREEQTGDNGLIEAIIDGRYLPERPGASAAPASGPDTTASAAGKRASR